LYYKLFKSPYGTHKFTFHQITRAWAHVCFIVKIQIKLSGCKGNTFSIPSKVEII